MSTTAIISIIISSVCIIAALIRVFLKVRKVYQNDKITLGRDGKKITISKNPTDEDRRKLAHF